MNAVEGRYRYKQIVVRHGGKDEYGRSVNRSEQLSQAQSYGSIDWEDIEMALREFVSNAIDATIVHNEVNAIKAAFPFVGVEMTIVAESEVRAKNGCTRVFIPLTSEESTTKNESAILDFYKNIGKWFLHFSEPWSILTSVLPKKARNIKDEVRTAVIYRRGVRVREISKYSEESLFDYNLNDLKVDESRNVDDYVARCAAGKALADAPAEQLAIWLRSFEKGTKYWEHSFDSYSLTPSYNDSAETVKARETNWAAASRVVGENIVVCSKGSPKQSLSHKGYTPLEVSEAVVTAGMRYGLQTPEKVMDADERNGRVIVDPTVDALACAEFIWDEITKAGMTAGKEAPEVKCFRSIMDGGTVLNGFYRDGCVYVNENLATGQNVELRQTMLEEIAHYVTGALDETRDLQDWAFGLAMRCLMVNRGELVAG